MTASDTVLQGALPTPGRLRSGVTTVDVTLAADALLRQGLRPTIERIREHLGRGSPNTINPLLDQWWKTLAARLSGGPELLERIPASAFHVLEALWVQLQLAARDRAGLSLAEERGEALQRTQNLEIRSQVLSLREGELNERMRRQEDRTRALEDQLQSSSLTLRRAEVERASALSRARMLEAKLSEARARIMELLTRAVTRNQASVRKNAKQGNKRNTLRPVPRKQVSRRKGKTRRSHR